MTTRLTAILCLLIVGLSLGGCTKCGWLWNERGRACQAEVPR